MISKGPDSVGVIDLAMRLGATGVRGNHEDRVIQEYENMIASEEAISEHGEDYNSAEPTLGAQNWKDRKLVKALGGKRIRWLKNCPVILRVGELGDMGNVIVVHAGLEPGVKLEKQDPNMVMNMRTIDKHGPRVDHDGKGWMKASNIQIIASNSLALVKPPRLTINRHGTNIRNPFPRKTAALSFTAMIRNAACKKKSTALESIQAV